MSSGDGEGPGRLKRLLLAGRRATRRLVRRLRPGVGVSRGIRGENSFEALFEESDQLFFFAHDAKHRFTYLSPSVESVLGYAPEELLGRPFEILHPGDPSDEQVLEATSRALEVGASQYAYQAVNRHKDGHTVQMEIVEAPIYRGGEVVGLLGFARDVSGRMATERALAESEARLRRAQKMDLVGRLAGGIAHDFNNILTAIGGYAELLMESLGEGDPRRDDAVRIREHATRGTILIRRLLAFGRREFVTFETLEPNSAVERALEVLRPSLQDDIRLEVELAPELPSIEVDPDQLEQVIANLVLNAVDAMPGGGRLTIRTGASVARPDSAERGTTPEGHEGPWVVISVEDTGHGMSPEVRTRAFEPFFSTRDDPGRGLGLSIVYGIMKRTGGDVALESETGRGTTVRVYLPVTDQA